MRRLGFALAATAAVTFCVGPFAWQALSSVRPEAEATSLGLPSSLSGAGYAAVLARGDFVRALGNSFLVASLTTALCLLLSSLAAFALSKLPLPGRRVVLALSLGASMFPPIATVSPLFLAIRALGLRDELAGLVLPYASFALPLSLWVLTSFFAELPDELYRAARVDGCSPLGAFFRVLLPLSLPGLVTTGLLVFISAWNEFLYALTFISSPSKRTVPVAVALLSSDRAEPWVEIAAASVVATLPLLVLTLVFQRRLLSGLTAGAVKG